jgi:hypothetical protein
MVRLGLSVIVKYRYHSHKVPGSRVDTFEWVLQDGDKNDPFPGMGSTFPGRGMMPSTLFYVTTTVTVN